MDTNKLFTGYVGAEVDSVVNIATGADVAGNTAGLGVKFYAKTQPGIQLGFLGYNVVSGVGVDPTLGTQEQDTVVVLADVGGAIASKYLSLYNGTSAAEVLYYVYFKANNSGTITGYDPKFGVRLDTTVQAAADVAGSLSSTYFKMTDAAGNVYHPYFIVSELPSYITNADPAIGASESTQVSFGPDVSGSLNSKDFYINVPGTAYYVWFSINGAGVDPGVGGKTGIPVAGATNATAIVLATAAKVALDAVAGTPFVTTRVDGILTITNSAVGAVTHAVDGAAPTGFGILTLAYGVSLVGALGSPIGVQIGAGFTAVQIAAALANAINNSFPAAFTATVQAAHTDTVEIVNVKGANVAAPTDGNTSFTFATVTAGVNVVAGLASATLLAAITLTYGGSGATNGALIVPILSNLGWATTLNTATLTIVHPSKGLPATGIADGGTGWTITAGAVAGIDPYQGSGYPATNTFIAIPVSYATGTTANNIALAWRTALTNHGVLSQYTLIGGTTNNVQITNIYLGTVSVASDVGTGWALTNPTPGTAAFVTNMGATTNNYYIKLDPATVLYLRKFTIQLACGGSYDPTKFGSISALNTGCTLQLEDVNGTVIGNPIFTGITTNAQLFDLGDPRNTYVDSAFNLHVQINIVDDFGGGSTPELRVSGGNLQRVAFKVPDDLHSLAGSGFTCLVKGHFYFTQVGISG